MKQIAVLAAALLSVTSFSVSAQETRDPLQVAQDQKVCDPAPIVDAKWLPDGRLQVTCGTGVPGAPGAGLLPAAGVAPLVGGALLLAVLGAGGSSTTTTQ